MLAASVITLMVGLLFLLYRWPRGAQYSFSQHAAQTKGSSIFYASLFLVAMPLLAVHIIFWFVPMFHAPTVLSGLIILVGVFQIACTFVSERGGERQITMHRWLAGISGALLLPAVICVAVADIDTVSRMIVAAGGLLMVCVLVWMVVKKQKTMNYRAQVMYYSGFLLPLAWMSYW